MTDNNEQQGEALEVNDVIDTCEVEWERPNNSICNPHKCELTKYHDGPHECSCGWKRRAMYRDEPERFDERLRG